ncbi:RtcB family protein [Amedibacillus sp. YH-ame6]
MDLKIYTSNIEEKAHKQVLTLMQQDAFKDSKVRIMPDVHAGKGCVIGFTGNLGDKVIPNIVGVDIGCGMLLVELENKDIDLCLIDKVIRENIPSGMNVSEELNGKELIDLLRCKDQLKNKDDWLYRSMGTLGGGNHFIEIDENKEGCKFLVIHTGSRNIGKQVAEIYQEKAIKHCSFDEECKSETREAISNLKASGKEFEIEKTIKRIKKEYEGKLKLPRELCYLEGKDKEDYLWDMAICIEYAKHNRSVIADKILSKCDLIENGRFHTIHNYIGEDNIVRKGAVSAQYDEPLLIPINMRDGCIVGVGKGNEDWNCSAPHGAGRIMSRSEANKKLSMEEYKKAMNGIYSTSISKDTLDEAPMAYKPMQEILDCIRDTVEVIDIIKPIYNFKASD